MQSSDIWDWFPIVFFPLKIAVLGVGMFYAIKWHRDQDKKGKGEAPSGDENLNVDLSGSNRT